MHYSVPVLKHASFTVPGQKLTAIVGDSGSGKSTILNLIAKYYEATGGTISIGGKPTDHAAAERVLEQISMVDQKCRKFNIFEDLGVCWSNLTYPYFCTSGCVWMWVYIFHLL